MTLSIHQIMVLSLYTLGVFGGPVPQEVIENALSCCDILPFDTQVALRHLSENGNVFVQEDEDKTPYLILTPQGKSVIDPLKKDVPLSLREKAVAFATTELYKKRKDIGIQSEIRTEHNNGVTTYYTDLEIKDGQQSLIRISVYAPNKMHARMIEENFRKSPEVVYRTVIKSLTENEEES